MTPRLHSTSWQRMRPCRLLGCPSGCALIAITESAYLGARVKRWGWIDGGVFAIVRSVRACEAHLGRVHPLRSKGNEGVWGGGGFGWREGSSTLADRNRMVGGGELISWLGELLVV